MKEGFTTLQVSKQMAKALKVMKNTHEYRTMHAFLEDFLKAHDEQARQLLQSPQSNDAKEEKEREPLQENRTGNGSDVQEDSKL